MHPVHVEAVANLVGRAELLVALGLLRSHFALLPFLRHFPAIEWSNAPDRRTSQNCIITNNSFSLEPVNMQLSKQLLFVSDHPLDVAILHSWRIFVRICEQRGLTVDAGLFAEMAGELADEVAQDQDD